jgi:hypothetical protein
MTTRLGFILDAAELLENRTRFMLQNTNKSQRTAEPGEHAMGGVELTIELDEPLYLALRLRAARERVNPAEVVNSILRKALPGELAVASGAPPLATVIRYVTNRQESHP